MKKFFKRYKKLYIKLNKYKYLHKSWENREKCNIWLFFLVVLIIYISIEVIYLCKISGQAVIIINHNNFYIAI